MQAWWLKATETHLSESWRVKACVGSGGRLSSHPVSLDSHLLVLVTLSFLMYESRFKFVLRKSNQAHCLMLVCNQVHLQQACFNRAAICIPSIRQQHVNFWMTQLGPQNLRGCSAELWLRHCRGTTCDAQVCPRAENEREFTTLLPCHSTFPCPLNLFGKFSIYYILYILVWRSVPMLRL